LEDDAVQREGRGKLMDVIDYGREKIQFPRSGKVSKAERRWEVVGGRCTHVLYGVVLEAAGDHGGRDQNGAKNG
jgi:hypothetical protein